MIFQRLIWAGLLVALFVGTVQTGVQALQTTPIILAAEVYEDQKMASVESAPASDHSMHAQAAPGEEAEEWAPGDGFERTAWTWVANLLHAFCMALLVFVVMGVSVWRGASMRPLAMALVTAAAGWLVFHFWPSIGLHAEIPGMDAARLGSRQGWWVLAAGSAAAACASLALMRSHLRWVMAAVLLAVPYLVGAPHITADPLGGFTGETQAMLRDLGEQFVWATTWLSLSFWLCMGLATGLTFQRWVLPTLRSTLSQAGELPQSA